jgi:hypothetical protein
MPIRLRVFVGIAALVCAAGCQAPDAKRSPLTCLGTPGWGAAGELLMRYEGKPGSEFLLFTSRRYGRGAPQAATYRYGTQHGTFEAVDDHAWKVAAGRITDSGLRITESRTRNLSIDVTKYCLLFMGRPVDGQPGPVLELRAVADDRVAVLTATRYTPGGIIFTGPEKVAGPYFHQLFSDKDGKPAGDRILLPFAEDSGRLEMGVSEDFRYVVYVDASFSNLCVVPVQADRSP